MLSKTKLALAASLLIGSASAATSNLTVDIDDNSASRASPAGMQISQNRSQSEWLGRPQSGHNAFDNRLESFGGF